MFCRRPLGSVFLLAAAAGYFMVATGHSVFAATILVTEAEANFPPPKEIPPPSDRGITRGPKIEFEEDKVAHRAPLHLKLRFKTFGGSAIDLGAVKATYIRDPKVDLTSRIKPFAQQSGIDIPDAQLPPGEHLIQINIKDSDGRAASKIIKLRITP